MKPAAANDKARHRRIPVRWPAPFPEEAEGARGEGIALAMAMMRATARGTSSLTNSTRR